MFSKVGKSKGFTASKGFFDRAWSAADKYIGEPMNKAAGKLGIEVVWPTTMDRECDKAARILRVFTLDGGVEVEEKLNFGDVDAKKKTQRVIKRIPAEALREAKGLAIFTVFRSGLGFSAASGSGIVIARRPDGSWGSPSGLLVHTLGFGFMIGIDVYDVILVLRTDTAVKSFTHAKVNLGGELALVAGPMGSSLMADAGYQQAPAWSYVKSKGFYAGVQLDGSIIIERQDENARFYGGSYSAADILSGRVHTPLDVEGLLQTIQAASDRDTKRDQIPDGLAPSEATDGRLEHRKSLTPIQPAEGFGAPPSYEDLDSISVKCSDCGATMSMEELSIHDCSGTTVRSSLPSEKRRVVPLPPTPRHASVPEDLNRRTDLDAETTEQAPTTQKRAVPPPPPTTRQLVDSEQEEHKAINSETKLKDNPSVVVLDNMIEELPTLELQHAAPDSDLENDMQEIKLDDDPIIESNIEMKIIDEDDQVAATEEEAAESTHVSKSPSVDSFRSAKDA